MKTARHRTSSKPRPITDDPYVGKYYHTPEGAKQTLLGRILAREGAEHYFIQTHLGVGPGPITLRYFPLTEIRTWQLFETLEAMETSYDQGVASRIGT